MNFNYQKAYCVQAVPAFNALPAHVKQARAKMLPLVADLAQGKGLAIPLSDEMRAILEPLTNKELAELARASYFVGHWHPSLLPQLYATGKGESWKVSNCIDQVLRARIETPHNIQIHEGKFRATFSNKYCWLWDEFGLATEENLEVFKTCGLPFGESTLNKSAKKLAAIIGDLWPDVDGMEDNELYQEYLHLAKVKQEADLKAQFAKKIKSLEQDKTNAQKEIEFLLDCNKLQVPVDNVIYYKHSDTFCFGWREKLTDKEQADIWRKLGPLRQTGTTYKIDFKK